MRKILLTTLAFVLIQTGFLYEKIQAQETLNFTSVTQTLFPQYADAHSSWRKRRLYLG